MGTVSCTTCESSTSCPFIGLDERTSLPQLVRHRSYAKGETIFAQGETISGCYVLCWGKVQLAHRTRDGRHHIIKFLRGGECFGEEGFIQASASSVSARALAESMVGWISPADFQELLRRNSTIAPEIQKRLSREITELRVRLAERAYLGARERLIKLLLELSEKYGCKGERGLIINLELTERDLAGMLGNTPEWICKQLGVLKQRGLVAYQRGELVILGEAELRRYITPPRERKAPCRSRKLAMIEVVH